MFLSCNGSGFPTVLLDAPTGMNSDVWAILSSKLSSLTRVKSVTRTASLTLYCSNAEILAGCCMFRYAFMIEQALASVIAHSRYKARFYVVSLLLLGVVKPHCDKPRFIIGFFFSLLMAKVKMKILRQHQTLINGKNTLLNGTT